MGVAGRLLRSRRAALLVALAPLAFGTSAAHPALLRPFAKLQATPRPPIFGEFGWSVGISADGRTAVVGTRGLGAWIFRRAGATWVQDGPPLDSPNPEQEALGCSVALAADGNTALLGAPGQQGVPGAAWVFTRNGTAWQATKLTPSEQPPPGQALGCERGYGGKFGISVALSGDGNTALVGAPRNGVFSRGGERKLGGRVGAAYVFVRSGATWTQQGPRLTASDEIGEGQFGLGLALSFDGGTALIGAPSTESGAAWVFTRSGSAWKQQGAKIVPRDDTPGAEFGVSAALSADGGTALIGGPGEGFGAAWSFVRSGDRWSQQGPKLNAAEQFYLGDFGQSVALSTNGDTAVISGVRSGGSMTNSPADGPGAIWTFSRFGSTWVRQGTKITGAGLFGWDIAASGDASTVLVGDPSDETQKGAAFTTLLIPPAPNSFAIGLLSINHDGSLDQQVPGSAAGTYRARATVSRCALTVSRHRRRRKPCRQRVLYGTGDARTDGPGIALLRVRPRRAVRLALSRRQELALSLTVTFAPDAGAAPASQIRHFVVEGRRRERF
jgi:hypothetical protein